MREKRDSGGFVTAMLAVSVAVIAFAGAQTDISEKTILWLIFGAVIAIGRASLAGQATGLGEIIDLLRELRDNKKDE